MITYPYSSLLTAFPTFVINLEQFQLMRLPNLVPPQSWISQETPLTQASWNLRIIAVWNTAAWLHQNEHNPTWLQNLACDIPEATWHLNNIASHPICNARHAETAPGLKKFEKLHSDKMQTTKCSHKHASSEVAPFPIIPNRDSHLKITDWKSWT